MRRFLVIILALLTVYSYGIGRTYADDPPAGIGEQTPTANGNPGAVSPTTTNSNAPVFYQGNQINTDRSKYSIEGLTGTVLPGVATWIAGFLAGLAVLFLIIAGIQFLTAGGDPEKISKATKTAFYVLAGILLAMFAYAIVYLFLTIFTSL